MTYYNAAEADMPQTDTRNPRIRIANGGRKNWRTMVQDDCGEWSITGPSYASKMEALSMVAELEHTHF